ncbi:MAG TPA: CaiB/BaiF CoA-transferase family protein [Rhizomicrobium sp.]|nr:CaiB/BaiF CoA-transferase family protein [Rhizomicrobium sp.]
MAGPLDGVRILEVGGIGPAPFAAMMLADNGAEVIRVHRPGAGIAKTDVLGRSRRIAELDLKSIEGIAALRRLARDADGLVEGFRPGTMERLGIGPAALLTENPRLVFGRMTGWGQTGPLAKAAGHDINYIALSGALAAIGRPGSCPVPPLALVGDFGGGGMYLAFAMTAALVHAQRTGKGQVVDCAMAEGASLLMAAFYGLHADGEWQAERGRNVLDGAAHFYDTYETADGKHIAIGAIEPQFYAELLKRLGIADPAFDAQMDRSAWPTLKEKIAAVFRTRTRDEWRALLEGTDACFAPVMSMAEAPSHAHMAARGAFTTTDGVVQPAPGPRYSATPLAPPRRPEAASGWREG